MADLPVMQFPPSQSPVLAAAVLGLVCAVLGGVQVVDGLVAAVGDEAAVVAQLSTATRTLTTAAVTGFEQDRWQAAVDAKAAASA